MVSELETIRNQLSMEKQRNAELLNTVKIIKLAQNIGSSDSDDFDITELKRKINEYIKEIDHCITMLND